MKIRARVQNRRDEHIATVSTNGIERSIDIPPRDSGFGSSANGGEILFLALATCYCNDIYREATRRDINVDEVIVVVDGAFGGEGEPASNITYSATVRADASEDAILDLMRYTDGVAEIQNTIRSGSAVVLRDIRAVPS